MDRIDLFRIFCRVVECGNFTKAADSLEMPRSSVSTAVQQLEERLGARLLNRTTRSVSTTDDGFAFYDRCQRLILEVEEAETLFRQDAANPSGRLRIDVPGRIGRLILAPALPEFLQRHPQIQVDLGLADRAVNLIEDRVDCVLRVGPLPDSGMIARKIGDLQIVNVASPSYLRAHGTPQNLMDLQTHLAVSYASPSTGRVEDWEWQQNGKTSCMTLPSRVTVNSAEALIACCLSGLGIIQVPAYDVSEQIRDGSLIPILPDHRPEPMPMHLLFPHRQHLSRRLQVFMDWVMPLMRRHTEV